MAETIKLYRRIVCKADVFVVGEPRERRPALQHVVDGADDVVAAREPGDALLFKLASFKELRTDKAGNTMGELHVPFLSNSPDLGERTIGRERQYVVVIRATGDGSEPCDATFNIWLSLTPRLHMTMVTAEAAA